MRGLLVRLRAALVAFRAPAPPVQAAPVQRPSLKATVGRLRVSVRVDWSTWAFAPTVPVGPCGCPCKGGAPCTGCGHARCGRSTTNTAPAGTAWTASPAEAAHSTPQIAGRKSL